MKDKLLKIINEIKENRGEKKIAEINESMHLNNDLGLDSFDLAELTVKLEAEFDKDIYEEGVVYTVKEVLERLS
jgi:acyl carrier protein